MEVFIIIASCRLLLAWVQNAYKANVHPKRLILQPVPKGILLMCLNVVAVAVVVTVLVDWGGRWSGGDVDPLFEPGEC